MTSMDTLGFEPRAFRMRSGCDATTPCALDLQYTKLGHVLTSTQLTYTKSFN